MGKTARHVRFRAAEGRGDELAAALGQAAETLRAVPACELWAVAQTAGDRDEVWVTEQWADAGAMQAALDADGAAEGRARVRALLGAPPEVIELRALRGVGLVQ